MSEDIFASEERQLINLYQRPPAAEMRRAIRLSIQYLVGAGLFLALAISKWEPLFAVVTYVVFVLYVFIRIWNAHRLSGVVPRILAKYERRVQELEEAVNRHGK